ncbi:MAG TPA: hypothetical protein VKM55_02365 [Candidatus Lokiarchaeia archaeon]|nr:hypothetical protein [Candidatus Lokiarchaeia archaeon]
MGKNQAKTRMIWKVPGKFLLEWRALVPKLQTRIANDKEHQDEEQSNLAIRE